MLAVEQRRAVLPDALQGAERPAEALLQQAADGLRRLGVGARLGVELHPPAGPLHGDGQVLVLGQRVGRIAAQRLQRRAPPGADRARHHGHRAQRRQRPALQVLGGDIFQRLPAGDQVAPVADQGVAGHRARPAGRRTSGPAWPMVSGGNRVSASSATTTSPLASARPRFSARALPPFSKRHQRHPRLVGEGLAHHLGGGVGRAVVEHQHLEPAASWRPGSGAPRRSITFSSLKQGISTLISGPVAGSGIGGVRALDPAPVDQGQHAPGTAAAPRPARWRR